MFDKQIFRSATLRPRTALTRSDLEMAEPKLAAEARPSRLEWSPIYSLSGA